MLGRVLVDGGVPIGCVEEGVGAQLQSDDWLVMLKKCVHQRDLAWPLKAMFHSVGSMRAHTVPGDAAAVCLKRRS